MSNKGKRRQEFSKRFQFIFNIKIPCLLFADKGQYLKRYFFFRVIECLWGKPGTNTQTLKHIPTATESSSSLRCGPAFPADRTARRPKAGRSAQP